MPDATIEFTPYVLTAFKKAYEKAKDEGKKEFYFNGYEFYTPYAKYLIEFLKNQK